MPGKTAAQTLDQGFALPLTSMVLPSIETFEIDLLLRGIPLHGLAGVGVAILRLVNLQKNGISSGETWSLCARAFSQASLRNPSKIVPPF